MNRVLCCTALLAALVGTGLEFQDADEPVVRRTTAPDSSGDTISFENASVHLGELPAEIERDLQVPGDLIRVNRAGSNRVDVTLVSGQFSEDQVAALTNVVRAHHRARRAAGRTGIEGDVVVDPSLRGSRVPPELRARYRTAETDTERIRILAEYLGFEE